MMLYHRELYIPVTAIYNKWDYMLKIGFFRYLTLSSLDPAILQIIILSQLHLLRSYLNHQGIFLLYQYPDGQEPGL